MRNRDQVRRVKRTFAQESYPNGNLISGTPDCGGVRDESDRTAVVVPGRPADNQSRPYLGGETEIHLPDLASDHLSGRRSSSRSI